MQEPTDLEVPIEVPLNELCTDTEILENMTNEGLRELQVIRERMFIKAMHVQNNPNFQSVKEALLPVLRLKMQSTYFDSSITLQWILKDYSDPDLRKNLEILLELHNMQEPNLPTSNSKLCGYIKGKIIEANKNKNWWNSRNPIHAPYYKREEAAYRKAFNAIFSVRFRMPRES